MTLPRGHSQKVEVCQVRTKAAVLWGVGDKWQVEEVTLDPPGRNEVLVKLSAAGLCHSDYHLITGDIPVPFPVIGGHEGAGVVAGVGPGVTDVAEGDSVVLSFLPACGKCSYCARGMTNLCDLGAALRRASPDCRAPCSGAIHDNCTMRGKSCRRCTLRARRTWSRRCSS